MGKSELGLGEGCAGNLEQSRSPGSVELSVLSRLLPQLVPPSQARPLKVSPQQPGPSGPVPQPPKTKLPSTSCVPDPTKQAEEILNAILPPR